MTTAFPGAGSNPPAGGSGTDTTNANPPVGGRSSSNPAQTGAPASGSSRANSPAEGRDDQQNTALDDGGDENATVSVAQHRETLREAKVNREKWQAAEKRLQALEDAKLTEGELVKKRLQEAEAQVASAARDNYALRLQIAIEERVRTLNLVSTVAVKSLLLQEYASLLDEDLGNVNGVINQAINDNPWLQKADTATGGAPNSGRQLSPQRAASGQFIPRQTPAPVAPKDWPTLGSLTKEQWAAVTQNERGPSEGH